MKVYVVTAYRWGDHEQHSYVVGAFSNPNKATRSKHDEEQHRGGKYSCEIVELMVDRPMHFRHVRRIPRWKDYRAFQRFIEKYLK